MNLGEILIHCDLKGLLVLMAVFMWEWSCIAKTHQLLAINNWKLILKEYNLQKHQQIWIVRTNLNMGNICIRRRLRHPTPVLLPGKSHGRRSMVGCSPWGLEESDTAERLHFHFYALEKEMATRSSVLAWRVPGTAEPGGLPSMGSHRDGHDWSDLAAAAIYIF